MDEKAIYAKGLEDGERKREEETQEKIAEMEEKIEELRQKAIMDEKAIYAKGLEDGERKRKEEMVKKMLEQKIDKKIIVSLTGMTLEEIAKLNLERAILIAHYL